MLKEDLKKLLKKYDKISDIYLFGSSVKGKFIPGDIDIAIITDKKDFELLKKINKELENYHNLHVELILFKEIFTEPIWKSLLSEGFSIKKNKYLSELMEIQSKSLYNYDLKELNNSEKTMFNRAFRAIITSIKGIPVSRGAVLIPTNKSSEFEDFLEAWKKVKTKKWRTLVI